MKLLFTCGGTAGHINPAVALARLFQARHPHCQVLFVGADRGMERDLVPKEGYDIRTVPVSNLWRSFSPAAIKHNVQTVFTLGKSRRKAREILKSFSPDLVVGTGGYASYPVVREAARLGIPTAVHESNAVPGLTTKALAKVVDQVMVGMEDSRSHYPHPEKVAVTGTPVRGDFFQYTKSQARAKLGLTDDRPLVLSYWGSLGAEGMNHHMLDCIQGESDHHWPFYHIHGAGRNYDTMVTALKERGIDPDQSQRLDLRPYIYDMPLVMAAADLVLCRAGASTISELTALHKPSILAPSPYVTNNHQEKNARVLERHGGALVVLEQSYSGAELYQQVIQLLEDEGRRKQMSQALSQMGEQDGTETIYQTLLKLMRTRG